MQTNLDLLIERHGDVFGAGCLEMLKNLKYPTSHTLVSQANLIQDAFRGIAITQGSIQSPEMCNNVRKYYATNIPLRKGLFDAIDKTLEGSMFLESAINRLNGLYDTPRSVYNSNFYLAQHEIGTRVFNASLRAIWADKLMGQRNANLG